MVRKASYILFGVLAIVIGLAIGAWLIYNILIERQEEFHAPVRLKAYLFPVVMVVVGAGMVKKGISSDSGE